MSYIEFKNVTKSFGGKAVLKGMSLAVNKGEVMFIIGTSGVGKSVTIKHLIGLLRIDGGEIWFDGKRVDQIPEKQLEDGPAGHPRERIKGGVSHRSVARSGPLPAWPRFMPSRSPICSSNASVP